MSDSALIPFQDMRSMAETMVASGMFGKNKEQMLSLMLIAQAEGIHPAIAAQEYDVIQGRPAINSKSALARFQAAGGSISWGDRTDTKASATFSHPQGGSLTVTWTMERAHKAMLDSKDHWRKYPAQMLSARVIAEGIRAVYPACLSRMYTVEEVADMEPMKAEKSEPRDVTPPKPEKKISGDKATAVDAKPEEKPVDPKAAWETLIAELGNILKAIIGDVPVFSDDDKAGYQARVKALPKPRDPEALRDIVSNAKAQLDALRSRWEAAGSPTPRPEVLPEPEPVEQDLF